MRNPLRSLPVLALLAVLAACSDAPEPPPADTRDAEGAKEAKTADANAQAPRPAAKAVVPSVPLMEASTRPKVVKVLAAAHRSAEDRARDAYRHPLETLSFFGLTRNMTVLEITPGSGWYADILAPTLAAMGRYIPAIWDETYPDQPAYRAELNRQLLAKFANTDLYGRLQPVRFDPMRPYFGEAGTVDMVVSFRNAHNWIEEGTAPAYFEAIALVLKPGGVLGLVDHRAPEGAPTDGRSGYVTEAQVIELARAAGLELADRSEINANPKDTKDHPEGVWTLPPTLALGDVDRAKYVGIGESDRMTLRFIKR
jgi:predicted methyltransferase